MTPPLIELSAFSFAIGAAAILRDLSFRVAQSDHLCIIGPNGAGKTTLLRCLMRIHRGGRGGLRVEGTDIAAYPQRRLARIIAYVPQATGAAWPFTAYQFALMSRYPYRSPFAPASCADHRAVREALAATGTESFADRPLATLSGGERQKVFIAAALAQDARVLLLDEATAFLDPRYQADIRRLLVRINTEHGLTILSVTHDVNSAPPDARLLALKEGRVFFDGRVAAAMNNAVLGALYDTRLCFVPHPATGRMLAVPEDAS